MRGGFQLLPPLQPVKRGQLRTTVLPMLWFHATCKEGRCGKRVLSKSLRVAVHWCQDLLSDHHESLGCNRGMRSCTSLQFLSSSVKHHASALHRSHRTCSFTALSITTHIAFKLFLWSSDPLPRSANTRSLIRTSNIPKPEAQAFLQSAHVRKPQTKSP